MAVATKIDLKKELKNLYKLKEEASTPDFTVMPMESLWWVSGGTAFEKANGESVKRIEEYARDNGYKLRGRHHEIYMSDPRRVAPDRLKTIVRHPLR